MQYQQIHRRHVKTCDAKKRMFKWSVRGNSVNTAKCRGPTSQQQGIQPHDRGSEITNSTPPTYRLLTTPRTLQKLQPYANWATPTSQRVRSQWRLNHRKKWGEHRTPPSYPHRVTWLRSILKLQPPPSFQNVSWQAPPIIGCQIDSSCQVTILIEVLYVCHVM
jgi:hypothetical protein